MEILKIENLSVQKILPELKFNVNLELKAGEIIAINGPSGVGKSILFRAISDLMRHQGKISLDNQDKNSFTGPQWRKKVMFVPAESQWWHETIEEHFDSLNTDLLHQFGFEQSILKVHNHQLSSGEKQRLALLRAIQYQPEVLLLDEPTANLDKHNTAIIEDFTRNYIKNNRAILWISHDTDQLQRISNSVLKMSKEGVSHSLWK
jgi:ABC-type iron transport system FetAB ATPase subunit